MRTSQGCELIACQSFAKNFGLYCERVGALDVCAADPASAAAAMTVLEVVARPMYSNPPAHGARVVAHILGDPDLAAVCQPPLPLPPLAAASRRAVHCVRLPRVQEWRAQLQGAMHRVKHMRALTLEALTTRGTPGSWGHITQQIGMFCYTGA